jgi:hypothetical protein
MKHIVNVAIAAALAIAAPIWAPAQAQTSKPPAAPAASAPAAPAASAPKQRHHRRAMHRVSRRGMARAGGETTTQQLNREELSRVQGMAAPPPPPAAMQGPRASGH